MEILHCKQQLVDQVDYMIDELKTRQKNKLKEDFDMAAKTLVAYFSASGVTEGVAKELAKAAGADLHEIKPQVPYTNADLDWTRQIPRSGYRGI